MINDLLQSLQALPPLLLGKEATVERAGEFGQQVARLSPVKIQDSFNEAGFDWAGQKYPAMVLPGMAAKFSGELEDLFAGKAKIMVGPEDSGRIIGWMKDFWPPK